MNTYLTVIKELLKKEKFTFDDVVKVVLNVMYNNDSIFSSVAREDAQDLIDALLENELIRENKKTGKYEFGEKTKESLLRILDSIGVVSEGEILD